jgi:hypothetical protein
LAFELSLDSNFDNLIDDLGQYLKVGILWSNLLILAHFHHSCKEEGVGRNGFHQNYWEVSPIASISPDEVNDSFSWAVFMAFVLFLTICVFDFVKIHQNTSVGNTSQLYFFILDLFLGHFVVVQVLDLHFDG